MAVNPVWGVWQVNGANDASGSVIAFLSNGTYWHLEHGPAGGGGHNGFEYGTYTWNAATGEVTAAVLVDTNGEWGLSDLAGTLTAQRNGDRLDFTVEGEGDGFAWRTEIIQGTNRLLGSWHWGASDPQSGGFVMMRGDGTFWMAERGPTSTDGQSGMEFGHYTWDPASGALKAQVLVDTNGQWGLSHPHDTTILQVQGNQVTATDTGNPSERGQATRIGMNTVNLGFFTSGVNMLALEPMQDQLQAGNYGEKTATRFVLNWNLDPSDADEDIYTGTDFTYQNGLPSGGTITNAVLRTPTQGGGWWEIMRMSRLNFPVSDFITFSRNNDRQAWLAALMVKGDTVTGSPYADVLRGYAGPDVIDGGTGNDTLYGDGEDDFLNGGPGADRMLGGGGNDTFVVGVAGDVVVESAGAGIDLVRSSVTRTLESNVENLVLTGTGVINGTGNTLDNLLTGNGAANVLNGGSGNDTLSGDAGADVLIGGAGQDRLTGGAGADQFKWVRPSEGGDAVTDFNAALGDRLALVSPNFGTLPLGSLASTRFRASSTGSATSSAQRLLFNTTTRALRFDPDGSGPLAATTVATLSGVNTLSYSQIVVVGS